MKATSTMLGLTLVTALSASDADAAFPSLFNAFRPYSAPVATAPYSTNYGNTGYSNTNYGNTGCSSCANGRCSTGVGTTQGYGYRRPYSNTTQSYYPTNGYQQGSYNYQQLPGHNHGTTIRPYQTAPQSPTLNFGPSNSPYFGGY